MTNDAGGPIRNLACLAEMLGTHEAHHAGSSRASVVSGGGLRQPLCERRDASQIVGQVLGAARRDFSESLLGPARSTARDVSARGRSHRSVGQSFPEIAVIGEFDEYPAQAVMRLCLPKLMQVNPEISKLDKTYESSSVPGERRRTFEKPF